MRDCKDCLRDAAGGCEALKHRMDNCFAKETVAERYIRGQQELIAYNSTRENTMPIKQAERNIKRVMRRYAIDNTKL